MVVLNNTNSSALYLMSVMLQCYSVIIDWGISASGHGKEVLYGINAIDKRYISQLMSNVQLPVSKYLIPRCRCTISTKTMM